MDHHLTSTETTKDVNQLVQQLVATVARAFYKDEVVVVLDELMRFPKYVREQELPHRLKLQGEVVTRVINQLMNEMLVKDEELVDDRGRTSKYYYVDYQIFVAVIRYRIYIMQKKLTENKSKKVSGIFYECPSCKGKKYNEFDVISLLSADNKFICPACCRSDNLRATVSLPEFTLRIIDNRGEVNSVYQLEHKLNEQLETFDGLHDGIINILAELKDCELIHNLPSDNRNRGYVASKILDEDIQREIENSLRLGYREFKHRANVQKHFIMGREVESITISIESDDTSDNTGMNVDKDAESASSLVFNQNRSYDAVQRAQEESLPDHLKGSGVKDKMDLVADDIVLNASVVMTVDDDSAAITANKNLDTKLPVVLEGGEDEDEDDIEWES